MKTPPPQPPLLVTTAGHLGKPLPRLSRLNCPLSRLKREMKSQRSSVTLGSGRPLTRSSRNRTCSRPKRSRTIKTRQKVNPARSCGRQRLKDSLPVLQKSNPLDLALATRNRVLIPLRVHLLHLLMRVRLFKTTRLNHQPHTRFHGAPAPTRPQSLNPLLTIMSSLAYLINLRTQLAPPAVWTRP